MQKLRSANFKSCSLDHFRTVVLKVLNIQPTASFLSFIVFIVCLTNAFVANPRVKISFVVFARKGPRLHQKMIMMMIMRAMDKLFDVWPFRKFPFRQRQLWNGHNWMKSLTTVCVFHPPPKSEAAFFISRGCENLAAASKAVSIRLAIESTTIPVRVRPDVFSIRFSPKCHKSCGSQLVIHHVWTLEKSRPSGLGSERVRQTGPVQPKSGFELTFPSWTGCQIPEVDPQNRSVRSGPVWSGPTFPMYNYVVGNKWWNLPKLIIYSSCRHSLLSFRLLRIIRRYLFWWYSEFKGLIFDGANWSFPAYSPGYFPQK